MKKIVAGLMMLGCMGFGANTMAAELKIGIVDLQKVIQTSPQMQKVQQALEQKFRTRRDALVEEEKQIRTKMENFKRDSAILSAVDKKDKEREIISLQQKFELEGQHTINPNWSLSGGYQYLRTGDKDQIADIKSGTVYTKNSQGYSRLMKLNEYVGLPNTSKHKLQVKLNYNSPKGYYLNLRAIYRSRWAVNNNNGNEVFDNGDVFASGYVAINSAAGKSFKNGVSIQGGIDNISNYIDATNLPNLPGRTFYTSIKYELQQNKN